jgi:PleD family two-component response regulator
MLDGGFIPKLLLVEDQEWTARSIESILRPQGFMVLKAHTGAQCLELMPRIDPDLVMSGLHLSDMKGVDLFRMLRERGHIRGSTPLLIVSIDELSQAERIEIFEAGAWDLVRPPFASPELTLKMWNWIGAKRDADQARDDGLLDPSTGVYNFKGLMKRVDEIVSEANRMERTVSFIIVASSPREGDAEGVAQGGALRSSGLDQVLATQLRTCCRLSDAVGRIVEGEFAVVAPHTDQIGASVLAERIVESLHSESPGVQLSAGVYSAHRSTKDPVVSVDLLSRAMTALRKAQAGSLDVLAYEGN